MTAEEVQAALERIERKAQRRYGVEIHCKNTPPMPGVVFGYAINISKCRGYRDCVHACVRENNLSRDTQYIRVVEMHEGSLDLRHGDHYYDAGDRCRARASYYLPMQCMQCDNPPCVKACPVEATWMEPDGIVVVDYDWCIGCRYCMAACPYQARHFNWGDPDAAAGRDQSRHPLPRQPTASARRGGEVSLLRAAHPRGPPARLPGGLSHRRAHFRQPARSGQRDPLRAGEQGGVPPQGGSGDRAEVLVLPR